MRNTIENKTFDEERALYNLCDTDVKDCVFAGPADGESVLKEARNIGVEDCSFSLRYPLWHVKKFNMKDSTMDEKTRAAIWYATDGVIEDSNLHGIKAVRECGNIHISSCDICSPEFGWKCSGLSLKDTSIEAEYAFFDSSDVHLEDVRLHGKYSFQYVHGLTVSDCILDTKDAFWHAKNIKIRNSIIKGEYLAWYCQNVTFENCTITGTQPLCYCKGLKLINCRMEDTDLSFEYSDVDADVVGSIMSVKNPRSGVIVCDGVGEIISEDPVMECSGKVVIREK